MKKKFKILEAKATEVSLCSKDNSGANKQTCFEIVKSGEDQKITTDDIKEFLKYGLVATEVSSKEDDKDVNQNFIDYIKENVEDSINCTLYSLLSDSLMQQMCCIKYDDTKTKEEKAVMYAELFREFVTQYMNSPITKSSDNTVIININKSLNQDVVNPQTVEKTGEEMEQENLGILNSVIETLKSLVSPIKKTETDQEVIQKEAEEANEVEKEEVETQEESTEAVETEEKAEDAKQEVEQEAEKAEEATEEAEQPTEAVEAEEKVEEAEKPQEEQEEVEKSSVIMTELEKAQSRIEELEKAQKENLEIIEKSKYITKAREEFSMLVGTPEEIGEKLFIIAKSNLPSEVQEYILNNFKQVAKTNSELVVEKGSNSGDAELTTEELEERDLYKKAETIAKEKGISINKALRMV